MEKSRLVGSATSEVDVPVGGYFNTALAKVVEVDLLLQSK